jgi:hypothetical protein
MRRGWEVELEDGTIIQEVQMDWPKVPKNRIVRLTLRYDGREWNITNKEAYLQKKRGSVIPFQPESFRVEARSIGYYEGNTKVWYTVKENTGKMNMYVEEA